MIFFFKLMDVNGYFFNLQLKTIPFLKFRHNFVLKGFVLSVVQYNLCLKNVCIAEAFSTRENYIFLSPGLLYTILGYFLIFYKHKQQA